MNGEQLSKLSNIQAEQYVLGSVLVDEKVFPEVSYLEPEDFYYSANILIYSAISELYRLNLPIDIVGIMEKLKNQVDFAYIAKLMESIPAPTNAWYYAEIVKKYSIARKIYLKSYEIQDKISEIDIDGAKEKARDILNYNFGKKDRPVSELFTVEELDRLTKLKRWKSEGLPILTSKVPFMQGENIYIAAQTGVGKTQLAVNLIHDFLQQGARVGYVSLEISKYQLLLRLLAWEYGESVPLQGIDLRVKDWQEMGISLLSQKIFRNFYFTRELSTLNEISSWIVSHSFDVCFVDYIQLVNAGGENRNYEIGKVAREFRRISDTNCMVVMSQLNRKSSEDDDYDLSRLRDSGEIEQTATSIIFLRRKEKNNNVNFSYAVRKNQTYGLLSGWIDIELLPTGKFQEAKE